MQKTSSVPVLLFCAISLAGIAIAYAGLGVIGMPGAVTIVIVAIVIAAFVARAVRVADPWERAIVLRLGKLRALRGPGLFGIIPIIDTIPYWIDIRVITSSFKAEKTLTRDTVPVDVDAVGRRVRPPLDLHRSEQRVKVDSRVVVREVVAPHEEARPGVVAGGSHLDASDAPRCRDAPAADVGREDVGA